MLVAYLSPLIILVLFFLFAFFLVELAAKLFLYACLTCLVFLPIILVYIEEVKENNK